MWGRGRRDRLGWAEGQALTHEGESQLHEGQRVFGFCEAPGDIPGKYIRGQTGDGFGEAYHVVGDVGQARRGVAEQHSVVGVWNHPVAELVSWGGVAEHRSTLGETGGPEARAYGQVKLELGPWGRRRVRRRYDGA